MKSADGNPVFDPEIFQYNKVFFEREYGARPPQASDLAWVPEPSHSYSFDEVVEQYPHYKDLLIDHPNIHEHVDRYLETLLPFCQSPFSLPRKQVIQGPWLGSFKTENFPLCGVNAETVGGKRVLDIGCNAGFDTFFLSTLGAAEVIGVKNRIAVSTLHLSPSLVVSFFTPDLIE